MWILPPTGEASPHPNNFTPDFESMPQFTMCLRYAKDDDPDNPENYLAPDIEVPSVFGNLVPPPSASAPSAASETGKAATVEESLDLVGGELKPPGEEDEVPEEVQVIVDGCVLKELEIVAGHYLININLTGGA